MPSIIVVPDKDGIDGEWRMLKGNVLVAGDCERGEDG